MTQTKQSPEDTIKNCPHCGNTSEFVGYGRDEADDNPEDTELTQPYFRYGDGDIMYDTHDGGEIGEYHAIECGQCGATLFGKTDAEGKAS